MRNFPIILIVYAVLFGEILVGHAQDPFPSEWEPLPLSELASRLDTPTSGAFFARTGTGLLRSDDGGWTWAEVPLPAAPLSGSLAQNGVVVDPSNHARLFAAGLEGVYRSMEEPVAWSLSLPLTSNVLNIAVSPADSSIVYVAAASGSSDFQIFRSDDSGDTWISIDGPLTGSVCTWLTPILSPHQSDPEKVFMSTRCHAGREVPSGGLLSLSVDRGLTRTDSVRRPQHFPDQLVGGAAVNADRVYLSANRGAEPGGGFVARSDDGGGTWLDVYVMETRPSIASLAMDSQNPDRVFLGLGGGQSSVLMSVDAGQTWSPLGSVEIGPVHAVALGTDGMNLFASTASGLWRYPLLATP